MKKCLIMLLTAALFVVVGCKKDNDNDKKMTFTSDLGGGAKTEINDHAMKWTTGDDIIINGETFACEVKEGGDRAEFTGKVVASPYNAYYPTSIWNKGTLTLPSTQYYEENNLSRVSPMYARSETNTLVFHNICALVKLNLKGIGTVKTITASADQSLSGEFTIAGNETDGYYANVSQLRDGTATVTLDCGQGVALAGTSKPFYIALPQGDYSNLKFAVSDGTITKEVTMDENNLYAGVLYEIEKEVELVADVPVESVSVSPTTLSLEVGATQQLTVTVLPENAANKNVTWSSDNTSVATVAADGTVTAVAAGTANITVTTEDGGKTATCVVTVTAPAPVVPTGAVSGKFSVAEGKQVYFSKGNLWCDNSTPSAPVWYFENNQYDFHTFGTTANGMVQNGVVSKNDANTWGLFAWSCENHPYGMLTESSSTSFDAVFVDWGNNPISNGGNNASQYKWRTLKATQTDGGEWEYLLKTRSGNRFAYAQVNGINGLVIFPDGWVNSSSYTFNNINTEKVEYTVNTINATTWGTLHEEGCVFLPAVGDKNGSGSWMNYPKYGYYWADGIPSSGNNAKCLAFAKGMWKPGDNSSGRNFGMSVRLVIDVPATNN